MEAIAWSKLIDALVSVEDVAPGDSGLLAFGAGPGGGGILVEKGRICWAAAPGMQQRLRDLLQAFAAGRSVDFEAIYERCRVRGGLLGQTLVDEGWITPRELESALRRHSAESLIALCHEDQRTSWISRGSRGYSPRFTFRPLDVLLDVAALSAPEWQDAARRELDRFDAPGRRGGAFLVEPRADIAVPVAAFGALSVQELWTLGRWALSLPLAMHEIGATPSFALASTAAGDTIAVWWRDALLYAVACDDRRGVTAIIAHHLDGDRA